MFSRRIEVKRLWWLLAPFLGGCVYFNTYFNANKAYEQALRMREERLEKNPEDTVLLSNDEKLKLERCITKCSKVLELYPDKLKYAPKALFLMGESYLLEQDYLHAVEKYEELLRYYPKAEEAPLAEVHRAKAVYLEGQSLKAKSLLSDILARKPSGKVRREALLLKAQMAMSDSSSDSALVDYETLLAEGGLTREERAQAHWEAARMAFDLGQWERARGHALAKERFALPTPMLYRNEKLALQCLYHEKRFREGITEGQAMERRKQFYKYRPEIQLLIAQGYAGEGDWASAERLFRGVPPLSPHSALAAEAFYRIGDHWLNVAHREDSARVYFDSAAAAGSVYEYGRLAEEKSKALSRLSELRTIPADSSDPQSQNFMISELFLFDLNQVDSAVSRLTRIVQSPRFDSTYTMRAAYALAYIDETYLRDTVKSDSMYRYVLQHFPHTEWAKQSQKNLGMTPTVVTAEDSAKTLFLAAEKRRFDGADLDSVVIPAYRQVAELFPQTQHAAQALYVIAKLNEKLADQQPPVPGSLDSAKAEYADLRKHYSNTPYGEVATEKLAAAGVYSLPSASTSAPGAVAGHEEHAVKPEDDDLY